jgi:hypothetical protein
MLEFQMRAAVGEFFKICAVPGQPLLNIAQLEIGKFTDKLKNSPERN